MFDQVEPTLLRYNAWSAIVLVPSYTRKMKPKARQSRPINLRIKRIMASHARRNMRHPSIEYPARRFCSIIAENALCRHRHDITWWGRGAGDRLILEQRAFDPLPV